jgi:membrane associated rhomboid family serine protease
MIPIGDFNPRRRFPWVTLLIVLVNVVIFIYQTRLPAMQARQFIVRGAIIPYRLTREPGLPAAMTLFTSMFLHGGWMHLISNMLYLWIFGDNIEDAFGVIGYVLLYLGAGLVAATAQIAIDPTSVIPVIGASGAVAGVLGAYLVLYPRARVRTLLFVFYLIRVIELPALIVLGSWFALQVINVLGGAGGNVAWFAHIGGFIAGMLAGWVLKKTRPPRRWSDPVYYWRD